MKRKPSTLPRKQELLDGIDAADVRLSEMVGRRDDGIPAQVRKELSDLWAPLLDLLMRAGRR